MSCAGSSSQSNKWNASGRSDSKHSLGLRVSLVAYRTSYCLYLLSMPFYTSTMLTTIVAFIIWTDMGLVDLCDLFMRIACLCLNSFGAFSALSRASVLFRIMTCVVNAMGLPLALYRTYTGLNVCKNPPFILPVYKLLGCPLLIVLPVLLIIMSLCSWIFLIYLYKDLHGCQDYPCLQIGKGFYGTFAVAPSITASASASSDSINTEASHIHQRKTWMFVMLFTTILQLSSIPAYLLVRTQQGFIPGSIEANVVGIIVDVFYSTYLLVWCVYGLVISTQPEHPHRLQLAWKLGIVFNVFCLLHLVGTIMTSPPMPFSKSTYYLASILLLNILLQQLWITVSALISRKRYTKIPSEP